MMFMFCYSRTRSLGLKDIDYYLYLLVFVIAYLLMKEVFDQLPDEFSYFYPQLVAVVAGTIFFGVVFGLVNAVASPVIFFLVINHDLVFLMEELSLAILAFLLVLVFMKQLSSPKFWKLLVIIAMADLGRMLVRYFAGVEIDNAMQQLLFLLPGMVIGSIMSLILLHVLCDIERKYPNKVN